MAHSSQDLHYSHLCFYGFFLRSNARVREDRSFLLLHPWALGIFLSETLAVIFFSQLVGLARDLSLSLLAFSGLILISGSLNKRPKRLIICFLATIVTVPGIMKMIPLPNPLFRITGVDSAGRTGDLSVQFHFLDYQCDPGVGDFSPNAGGKRCLSIHNETAALFPDSYRIFNQYGRDRY